MRRYDLERNSSEWIVNTYILAIDDRSVRIQKHSVLSTIVANITITNTTAMVIQGVVYVI